ncbi:hypothetical protein PV08_09186 [Exophiala spinifera]|uniref:Protein arginine N-methyltransferase n=1 Tax=Exophiala spinifera TaxID=91928 RepID=A0A0D2AYY0_9EURO|nr:uncharacterized protein PV08_09186 [Exophiala spinifera]KIW11913.1 hypothetical protein PV08_09186 [Exophiala spinifera]
METLPRFVIGHHDPKRPLPVTAETIQAAHAANYDMVTSPITTPHFHSRVLTLLSASLSQHPVVDGEDITKTRNASPIVIPPLTPADTPLTPGDTISQIIGVTSSWIDLSSPDPIIADVSRQVLRLELAYAAFCGVTYVVIPGPRLRGQGAVDSGIAEFARAIVDGISQGPYMQLYIWFPLIDNADDQEDEMGDLAPFARQRFSDPDDSKPKRLDVFGSWEAWDMIRSICKYPSRLCVALSLPKLLPPTPIQSRWYSEPVRLVTLDSKIFSKNAKGYPVLSRAHQAFISRFSTLRTPPWFLLCNTGPIVAAANGAPPAPGWFPPLSEAVETPHLKDPTPHLSYMRNLQNKQPVPDAISSFGAGYQDYLQAPLQPLTVNLESVTYEVFEKDPIKYAWYERAIARALHDWIEQGKPTSNPDGRVVVAVVGAGRGPLVTRALKASEEVGVEIDMWALEKNPNAYVLLQRHNATTWNNKVNLVKSDMRTWRGPVRGANTPLSARIYNQEAREDGEVNIPPTAAAAGTGESYTGSPSLDSTYLLATAASGSSSTPYKIDILVSELLGSFADNELSPECLDGVQHLMNPVHGISIPASYTAHITPIAAPKLHADIMHGMTPTNPSAPETPYVVMFNAIDHLSTTTTTTPGSAGPSSSKSPTRSQSQSNPPPTPPTPIIGTTWSFQHPNPSLPPLVGDGALSNAHNARRSTLTFPIPNRGTCHGLAGYFETVLYKGVELSTNPNTMDSKSEGMISWFPIFFPLKTPLTVPDKSELTVTMYRRTDDRKVWYEWLVDVYICIPDGRDRSVSGPGGISRGGRKIRVGGSELHSSEKEACLM